MELYQFLIRAGVYLLSLIAAWYGMSAVNYEAMLRKGHVRQAQVLYIIIVMGLAYLAGSFLLAFMYRV